ncbi:hypothetical protein F0562_014544 [Nyssa sinensis]|uniref:Beta-glucosidase n=1 Tax=Nyssa sinensis TaxID=561372 RepID=A0A5J4ZRE6_9ASTE|nr:hypothetical protein F0562_014544 [Nyssa sinensis]
MAIKGLLLLVLIAFASTVARSESDDPSGIDPPSDDDDDDDTGDGIGDDDSSLGEGFRRPFGRKDFPANFIFGTASSAYQEDVKKMKNLGFDAFRLSISWSRILPGKIIILIICGSIADGYPSSRVNRAGIRFYNNLIDELKSKGIEPYVTLFHWDLPQVLESDCKDVPIAAKKTEDEDGVFLVGRFAKISSGKCKEGNSGTEPYLVSHNLLLAHAAAVNLYRNKYQDSQKGQIGITLNTDWLEPFNERSKNDQAAA